MNDRKEDIWPREGTCVGTRTGKVLRFAISIYTLVLVGCATVGPTSRSSTVLPSNPGPIADKIAELGSAPPPVLIRTFRPLYQYELEETASHQNLIVRKDVAYGQYDQNRLDVISPREPHVARPVVIFLHGGGFSAGDKSDGLIHDNVGRYFATNGFVAVNATYRKAPPASWPSGREDVSLLISWVKANIKDYGGNPKRLFLIGHAAGAAHAASYMFGLPDQTRNELTGAVLISGAYRPRPLPGDLAYYGPEESAWANRSPSAQASLASVPVMLVEAQYDSDPIKSDSEEMYKVICKSQSGCPQRIKATDHNHVSIIFHFNTKDQRLGKLMIKFMNNLMQR